MAALSIDDEFNLLKKGYPAKPMLSMLYIKMGEGMTKRQALEYLAFSHTEMFSQYVSAIHVHAQHEDF
jgi:hypothetical protein